MKGFSEKLHISSIDENCRELALKYGMGLEVASFCWAQMIDFELEKNVEAARRMTEGIGSLWFHAPFAELAPCAIDPRARKLARTRYRQSAEIARRLGIKRLVIHGGFIPHVYYPEYYTEQSVLFWKEFLKEMPEDMTIALENVMEPSPDMLVDIADGVDDPRLGLCLDVGHANTEVSRTPPIEWIGPMAKRLFHVHLHNNIGGTDLHDHLGNGSIPVEKIIREIMKKCPRATFTIEDRFAEASLEWLKERGLLQSILDPED